MCSLIWKQISLDIALQLSYSFFFGFLMYESVIGGKKIYLFDMLIHHVFSSKHSCKYVDEHHRSEVDVVSLKVLLILFLNGRISVLIIRQIYSIWSSMCKVEPDLLSGWIYIFFNQAIKIRTLYFFPFIS